MKIILTGASGLLGAAVARSAHRRKHQVIGIVHRSDAKIAGLSQTVSLDLRDLAATEAFVLEQFPDAIVNCAAISEVKDCQSDPERARQLNVDLPEKLALLSRHLFARYIHISTDQVYDGKNPPYQEDSPIHPENLYARQKRESEERVQDLAAEFATTLRLPLLTGNSPSGERSFHERLFMAWEKGEQTPLFTDEIRQPCLADNAADAIVELVERTDLRGLYNWAGFEALSRYQMGLELLEKFGLPTELAQAAQRGDDPRFAHRQPNLSFDLTALTGKLKTRPLDYAQQLDALIVPPARRKWYNAL